MMAAKGHTADSDEKRCDRRLRPNTGRSSSTLPNHPQQKKNTPPTPEAQLRLGMGFFTIYLSKGMGLYGGVTPHHSPISPPDPPAYPPGSVQLFSLK